MEWLVSNREHIESDEIIVPKGRTVGYKQSMVYEPIHQYAL